MQIFYIWLQIETIALNLEKYIYVEKYIKL